MSAFVVLVLGIGSLFDYRTSRVPNSFTFAALGLAILYSVIFEQGAVAVLVGGLFVCLLLWNLRNQQQIDIKGADAKLILLLGITLGPFATVEILSYALLSSRWGKPQIMKPFVPHLFLGALVYLVRSL